MSTDMANGTTYPAWNANNPADEPEVIVCAGPPDCDLQGDEAIAAANSGCPRCRHIVIHADGTETEYQLKAH